MTIVRPFPRAGRGWLSASWIAAIGLLLSTTLAHAGIAMPTRLIYPSDVSEVSLEIKNHGDVPTIVQLWTDDDDVESRADDPDLPFLVMPPLFELASGESRSVRVMLLREVSPSLAQEKLFAFNVLYLDGDASNAEPAGTRLRLAVRTRLKLFFRPASLVGIDLQARAERLDFALSCNEGERPRLVITNRSPFYLTFKRLSLGGREIELMQRMLGPRSKLEIDLSRSKSSADGASLKQVDFELIGDEGVGVAFQRPLHVISP